MLCRLTSFRKCSGLLGSVGMGDNLSARMFEYARSTGISGPDPEDSTDEHFICSNYSLHLAFQMNNLGLFSVSRLYSTNDK